VISAPVPAAHPIDHIFRNHNNWLQAWLRRRLGSRDSAEDVASEVFVRMVALSYANVGAISEPRALLTTIARRVIYELWRRNDLQRAYEMAIAALPEQLVASPEEHAIVLEALRTIDEVLSSMSAKARAAFLYSQVDGLSYGEIADLLGVSPSRVRQYVAQGFRNCYAQGCDGQTK
jgi:RNA polymerase sigma-19 factor, ECF subfamily